ncbi:imidazoleglycerol-phosphate dehydratase HisB [Alkaliphilus transvaalensis]|uniref:imidazoleglycerol-phosphate dehydratase HisB n=1 Tax=Alkaliphilus transvaalensis TaxID=114628 RepID=UPI00047E58FA|nr:imidazoleglycerol-phosphate dehydratase HisB [Alkaliphilus transvaalensis]
MKRGFEGSRKTNETEIKMKLQVDGEGEALIDTGIAFFDHMLHQFSKHGLMDLSLQAKGDLEVDFHHTVEDVGILLGEGLKQALGDKSAIKRYATVYTPMDEALGMVAIDISGRSYLHFDVIFRGERTGNFEVQLVEEFFRAFAFNSGITLHVKSLYGNNDHHIIEALFKSLGRAIDEATQLDPRIKGVRSTKGSL